MSVGAVLPQNCSMHKDVGTLSKQVEKIPEHRRRQHSSALQHGHFFMPYRLSHVLSETSTAILPVPLVNQPSGAIGSLGKHSGIRRTSVPG